MMMFTTTMIALGLATGIGAATPVKLPVDAAVSAVTSATTTGSAPTRTVKPTRYCVREVIAGSRLERQTCWTRAEWLDQGFDPLKAK